MTTPAVASNPNAVVGGIGGGVGLGELAQWLLNGVLHWNVSPAACVAVAGGLATVVLFVGRRGLVGVVRQFLYGPAKK